MRRVSEGAESVVYSAEVLGIRCIAKSRIPKRYRIKELDESLRFARTKAEARITAAAHAAGAKVPRVLLVDGFDIYFERIDGKTLNRALGKLDGKSRSRAISEAGQNLALLHNADIAHGDYTPANIMVSGQGEAHVIDFGLAEQTKSVEEKAIDVLLMKRSLAREQYTVFLKSYIRTSTGRTAIMGRLREIEGRGRYQTRTLAV